MRNQRKTVFAVLIIVLLFTGCAKTDVLQTAKNLSQGEEIDYTVVAAEDIPPTLASEIDAQAEQEFRLTYSDGGYLYLARGYGKQPAGSSIRVTSLRKDKDDIYFATTLLGSSDSQPQDEKAGFPYIVVKLADYGQNVVFE